MSEFDQDKEIPLFLGNSTYHPKVVKVPNIEKYSHYLYALEASWTGRIDASIFNTFLLESVQLLKNSILLFRDGYFDAAFYSMRQAIELSTTGVYLTDFPEEKNTVRTKRWRSHEWIPPHSKMIEGLKENGNAFGELHTTMPSLDSKIIERKEVINKIVHKQGFDSFYCIRNHPVHSFKYSTDELTEKFDECLVSTIGIVAMMRLAVDPFPVLLNDPAVEGRYTDSQTSPFSDSFILECIGETVLSEYKNTSFYLGHREWIIETFPKLSEAAFDVADANWVDITKKDDLLEDLKRMSMNNAFASILMLSFPDLMTIYAHGGLTLYTNSQASLHSSTSSNKMLEGEDYNQPYEQKAWRISDGTEHVDLTTFLSPCTVDNDVWVIESFSPLTSEEIQRLEKVSKELRDFFKELSTGEISMDSIDKLNCVKTLRN